MNDKSGQIILLLIILGLVVGILGGIIAPGAMIRLKFVGVVFLNALKMISVPLVVLSVIVAIVSIGTIGKSAKMAGRTILYFLATTAIATLLGLILVNLLAPGAGLISPGGPLPESFIQSEERGLIDIFSNLVPASLPGAAFGGQYLSLVVFALLFGGALTTLGSVAKPVIDLFEALYRAVMRIVTIIIYFAPIGILSLLGSTIAENHGSLSQLSSGLGMLSITIIVGVVIHAVVILPLILKYLGKENPFSYLQNMGPALSTAFATSSSTAALPITLEGVIERNSVNRRAGTFVAPLGAAMNIDGAALFQAVAVVFIAQAYQINLGIASQVVILVLSVVLSIIASAVPFAVPATMTMILSAVGVPVEGVGLIWVVYWILERFFVTVNVWSASVGAAVIAETLEEKHPARIPAGMPPSEKKTERYEPRKTAPDKGYRTGRYEERPRGQRPSGYQRKEPKREERRPSPERKRRQEPREGVRKEPAIPREHIQRELERLRKQAPAVVAGTPKEPQPESPPAPKKDEFFETEIPKFNFFPEEKAQPETNVEKPVEEPPAQANVEKGTESEPGEQTGPPAEEKVPPVKKPTEAEEEEEDAWGRARKRHPSK